MTDSWEFEPTHDGGFEQLAGVQPVSPPEHRLVLMVIQGDSPGRVIYIGSQVQIGRSAAATILINESEISREHAVVRRTPSGGLELEDIDSTNGTLLNGVPVQREELHEGDKISVGSRTLIEVIRRNPVEERYLETQKLEAIVQLASGLAMGFQGLAASQLATVERLRVGSQELGAGLNALESAAKAVAGLADQLGQERPRGGQPRRVVGITELADEVEERLRTDDAGRRVLEAALPRRLLVLGDHAQLVDALYNICAALLEAEPRSALLLRGLTVDLDVTQVQSLSPLRPGSHVFLQLQRRARAGADVDDGSSAMSRLAKLRLAIAKGIVQAHGGTLQIEVQGGALVHLLYLPAAPSQRRKTRQSTDWIVPVMQRVALLVNADAQECAAAGELISELGFTPVTAASADEALQRLLELQGRLSFVLLDLSTPPLSGPETLRLLTRAAPGIPILIISNATEPPPAGQANGYLYKPLDPSALHRAIAALEVSEV